MQDHRGCTGIISLGSATDGVKYLVTMLLSHTEPLRGARFGRSTRGTCASLEALRELSRVVRLGVFVVNFRLSENVITFSRGCNLIVHP